MFEILQIENKTFCKNPDTYLLPEEVFRIIIPHGWWYSKNTFERTEKYNELRILHLENRSVREIELPKPNYWNIHQGDYRVHEEYKRIKNRRKIKRLIAKCFLSLMLLLTIAAVSITSSFFSNF